MCIKGSKLTSSQPPCHPGLTTSITRPRPDELDMMFDLFPTSEMSGVAPVSAAAPAPAAALTLPTKQSISAIHAAQIETGSFAFDAPIRPPPSKPSASAAHAAQIETGSFVFYPDVAAKEADEIMTTPGMGLEKHQKVAKMENLPESPRSKTQQQQHSGSGSSEGDSIFGQIFGRFACFCV
eukprot:CAMPEP_0194272682 /NCGR_PEP_ID=MMETSP0169-20130528/6178_1 /TAXON_ID=218684 /ORGANISM="Corethron pennatum, Strain L29A3" /LENGTH=180 /DNA_ID=CAMNT_0039015403 /DNA_START=214 /DNA_END=756 /DNA_ORIENTATION=+